MSRPSVYAMCASPYTVVMVRPPLGAKANEAFMVESFLGGNLEDSGPRSGWMANVIYDCVKPERERAKNATFVVTLADYCPTGVPAVMVGVAVCQVHVRNTHERYVTVDGDGALVSSSQDGFAQRITPRPGGGVTGPVWCTVRLPVGGGGSLFPVFLNLKEGGSGSASEACSYAYHAATYPDDMGVPDADMADGGKPRMQRWPAGRMKPAQYGLASWNDDGKVVIFWCDEVPVVDTCEEE